MCLDAEAENEKRVFDLLTSSQAPHWLNLVWCNHCALEGSHVEGSVMGIRPSFCSQGVQVPEGEIGM